MSYGQEAAKEVQKEKQKVTQSTLIKKPPFGGLNL
jgi:hypothetical protein